MRNLLCCVVGVALTTASADAADFWLSEIGEVGGGVTQGVPDLVKAPGATGQAIHIWGRPDSGETLEKIALNIRSTNPDVLDFTEVLVHNPFLASQALPPKPIHRYEFLNDSTGDSPISITDPDRIANFSGFGVTGDAMVGAGLGPDTTTLDDGYDATADAWLIATVHYDATDGGMTDLFLQIGELGVVHRGGASADTNVIFGNPNDPAMNAASAREQDSATADAHVTVGGVVPEPSAMVLAVFAMFGMMGVSWRKRK